MFEQVVFVEVLRPFRKLQQLSALIFPRNTEFRTVSDFDGGLWPPSLQAVTLNGFFPTFPFDWGQFVSDWPPSLHHLVVDKFCGRGFVLGDRGLLGKTGDRLHSVYITGENSEMYHDNLVIIFSGLQFLSIPANLAMTDYYAYHFPPYLKQLEIRAIFEEGPHHFDLADLLLHTNSIPSLQQIRLHKSLVEDDHCALESVDGLLKSRAISKDQDNGGSGIRHGAFGLNIFGD